MLWIFTKTKRSVGSQGGIQFRKYYKNTISLVYIRPIRNTCSDAFQTTEIARVAFDAQNE
jgi:hypothetical protein